MRTVNSVTLMGNIARSAEKRVTMRGKMFTTFIVATHQDSSQEREKNVYLEFHNIIAWGGLANIAENFCKQGALVYIEGYLKTRSWNHENGAKIFRTEVVATNIISVSSGESEEERGDFEKNNKEDNKDEYNFFKKMQDETFFNSSSDDFFEK